LYRERSEVFEENPVIYLNQYLLAQQRYMIKLYELADEYKQFDYAIDQLNKINTSMNLRSVSLQKSIPYCDFDEVPKKVPMYIFGSGAQYLFSYLCSIISAKNRTLIIDEVDRGFHYSAMPALWRSLIELAQEHNVQLFATTHSMECVRAFSEVANIGDDKGKAYDARLVNLRKPEGRHHEALIYHNAELAEVLDDGLELT